MLQHKMINYGYNINNLETYDLRKIYQEHFFFLSFGKWNNSARKAVKIKYAPLCLRLRE